MAVEVTEAKRWIYETLKADAQLVAVVGTRIYPDIAPQGKPRPYLIFNFQGGVDVSGLGTARLQTNPLFQVRIVTDGAPNDAARTADARLDEVLQNSSADTSNGYMFSARREMPVDRPEFDADNNRYHNLGGLYRLYVSKL